jgi:hypothetical protein
VIVRPLSHSLMFACVLLCSPAWTQICRAPGSLNCEQQCGPAADVGEAQYQTCMAKCLALPLCTGGSKCGGLPIPVGPCATYLCVNGQLKQVATHPGAICTIGGMPGSCSASGACIATPPPAKVAVITYHYDNLRTGWNQNEAQLTPTTVASSRFGILSITALPDGAGVDTQPLIMPGQKITAGAPAGQIDVPGTYDVVYVATEANDIYGIDSATGTPVVSANLGTPVNSFITMGITGTPVIDAAAKAMYAVAYTSGSGGTAYTIHSLNLSNLTDNVTPQSASATNTATDIANSTISFTAGLQRQRPALVESNGNVYAGFGSLGDNQNSRGWVLGWSTPSLTPLLHNQLNNRLSTTPHGLFLSSVWMSGYGVAADPTGNLYFVTGNSDVNVKADSLSNIGDDYLTEYQGVNASYGNIADSVVSVLPDLSGIAAGGVFTPWAQTGLDQWDYDFGSGGAMLLPDQTSPFPHLLAAAGKDGKMYVLNRDSLGGYNQPSSFGQGGGEDHVVAEVNVGGCWCGPSYFNSGGPYIVSSGGSTVMLWSVRTSPLVSLVLAGTSTPVVGAGAGGADPGFFTSVSSNGSQNAIIWAVSRPDANQQLWLYAFNAQPNSGGTLPLLFKQPVGTWAEGGNTNVVPVVANGKVYVATNGHLTIFGLH